ncbi:MAG: DUF3667 domain-containing protein [Bacteroidetes bacterium]|nr:MAG: DUF3667 domain-containing protein [Bacteroidota bacterium]
MSETNHNHSRLKEREEKVCLNCNASLFGRFCQECGQENIEQKIPIGTALLEFLNAFTFYDSKFFKTFIPLIIKPGFLVNEHNSGKRTQYLTPAKTYFFLSFIFFLILFSIESTQEAEIVAVSSSSNTDSASKEAKAEHKLLAITTDSITTIHKYDSVQNSLPEDKRDGAIKRWYNTKAIKAIEKMQNDPTALEKSVNKQFNNNLPQLVFVLVPIVALILKLLYLRKKIYLVDHITFSLNIHAFVFLSFTFMILVSIIFGLEESTFMAILFLLILVVYVFIAVKRVYKQNWFYTSLKTLLLSVLYCFIFSLGVLVNTLYSLISAS